MSSRLSLARKGFNLFEMMIVITILCVLAAIIFPVVRSSRENARRVRCSNNMKNLALGCINYESTNARYPAVIASDRESFLVRILPMLESSSRYDVFRNNPNKTNAIDHLANLEYELFRCPSAASSDFEADVKGSFTCHYVGCAGFAEPVSATDPAPLAYTMGPGDLGLNGLFSPRLNEDGTLNIGTKNGVAVIDVHDGMSNTMAIIETSRGNFKSASKTFTNTRVRWSWGLEPTNSSQVNWGRSVDRMINSFDDVRGKANPFHGICISSNHPGGAGAANGDGSIHFVFEDQDLEVLQAVAGIDDGVEADLNY